MYFICWWFSGVTAVSVYLKDLFNLEMETGECGSHTRNVRGLVAVASRSRFVSAMTHRLYYLINTLIHRPLIIANNAIRYARVNWSDTRTGYLVRLLGIFIHRPENGGKFCVGHRVRYKSCNHEVSFYLINVVRILKYFTLFSSYLDFISCFTKTRELTESVLSRTCVNQYYIL